MRSHSGENPASLRSSGEFADDDHNRSGTGHSRGGRSLLRSGACGENTVSTIPGAEVHAD